MRPAVSHARGFADLHLLLRAGILADLAAQVHIPIPRRLSFRQWVRAGERRQQSTGVGPICYRVIRPALGKLGLEWTRYHAGRRGSETEMNRYTNGNSQITMPHFGHSKEVADAHCIKPLPDETRRVALRFDRTLASKGQNRTVAR